MTRMDDDHKGERLFYKIEIGVIVVGTLIYQILKAAAWI